MSFLVFHSSLLTAKSVDLVVAHDGFLCILACIMEFLIVCIFHKGYFDNREKFFFVFFLSVADGVMDTLLFR